MDGFTIEGASVGLRCVNSDGLFQNLSITGSQGNTFGGGMEISGGSPTILNNLLVDNLAGSLGGGIAVYNNSNPLIQNNTLVGNTIVNGAEGHAIAIEFNSDPILADNIIVSPDGCSLYADASSNPQVSFTLLWPNTVSHFCGALTDASSSNGNVVADPLFVTSPLGGFFLSQPLGISPDPLSPAVDSGSVAASARGMDAFTTRTDSVGDTGLVDRGYHGFDLVAPSAPGQLEARPGETWMTLEWSAVPESDLEAYELELATDPAAANFQPIPAAALSGFDDPYTGAAVQHRFLAENQEHFYRLRTVDAANNASPWSFPATAITNGLAPDQVSGVAASTGDAFVQVSWAAVANGNTYRIYRSEEPRNGFRLIAEQLTATSSLDRNLVNGRTYYYRIGAVNSRGEGLWSLTLAATPSLPTPTPTGLPVTSAPTATPTSPATSIPTASPAQSPTPSPTPTPTSTCSPTPEPTPPAELLLAGYGFTDLREDAPGELVLLAFASGGGPIPVGYLGSQLPGVVLSDDGAGGDAATGYGLFTLALSWGWRRTLAGAPGAWRRSMAVSYGKRGEVD